MTESEKFLDENGYKPIECLEDLGKDFKWWKKFRESVIQNFECPVKIWVKIYVKQFENTEEEYLAIFILDIENDEVLDYLLKPNGIYSIRDDEDLETLKAMYEDFSQTKNDLMPSNIVC